MIEERTGPWQSPTDVCSHFRVRGPEVSVSPEVSGQVAQAGLRQRRRIRKGKGEDSLNSVRIGFNVTYRIL